MISVAYSLYLERGSSAAECRTRNLVSPGCDEHPFATASKIGNFRSLHWRPSWLSYINEYLAIDSGGNVSDLVVVRNWCMTRMLPVEAELLSEWTCLPGIVQYIWDFWSGKNRREMKLWGYIPEYHLTNILKVSKNSMWAFVARGRNPRWPPNWRNGG